MDLESVLPIKAYHTCMTLALSAMLLIIHFLNLGSNAEKYEILRKVLCKAMLLYSQGFFFSQLVWIHPMRLPWANTLKQTNHIF